MFVIDCWCCRFQGSDPYKTVHVTENFGGSNTSLSEWLRPRGGSLDLPDEATPLALPSTRQRPPTEQDLHDRNVK